MEVTGYTAPWNQQLDETAAKYITNTLIVKAQVCIRQQLGADNFAHRDLTFHNLLLWCD